MVATDETQRAAIQLGRGFLIVTVQAELDRAALNRLRHDLLERIRVTGARGAVFDLSGVDVMDTSEFMAIRHTVAMAELMGTACVLAGMRAGVVSALVELGYDADGLYTALNVDAALVELDRLRGEESSGPVGDDKEDDDTASPDLGCQ